MNIESKTILITGANRGVDRALVEETLNRGAKRVYGGTRQPFKHSDQRVTPVILDVTNAEQIQKAIESIAILDILVNNAGIDLHDDLSDRAGIERHLAVNLFGTHGVTQAFLPLLVRSQGAIVNVLSLAALASTVQSGIRDLEGGCVHNDAIAACSLGGTWCEGACSLRRPGGHRYDSKPRYPEGFSRVRRAGHPRWNGEKRGGHLPRPDVGGHRRWLAQ